MNINRMQRRASSYRFWGWVTRILVIGYVSVACVFTSVSAFSSSFALATLGLVGHSIATDPGMRDGISGNHQPITDEEAEAAVVAALVMGSVVLCVSLFPNIIFWFLSQWLFARAEDIEEKIVMIESGYGGMVIEQPRRHRRQPYPDPPPDTSPQLPFPKEVYADEPALPKFIYDQEFYEDAKRRGLSKEAKRNAERLNRMMKKDKDSKP